MKQVASTIKLLLLSCFATTTYAQHGSHEPATGLFGAFPNTITCSTAELSKVFPLTKGNTVDLGFGSNFRFAGTIASNDQRYNNLQSVIIKSPAFSNAIFQLSKRINADNSITYVGRIYNEGYADGYQLKKDNQGNYQLVKFETEKIRQTCDHH